MKQKSPSDEKHLKEDKYTKPFIVGIGASAGGLEALEVFFDNMPEETTGTSFVIIQHLSPDYKSLMSELLKRHTPMPVFEAEDGMEIEPDSVYLIPRKTNMTIFNSTLFLDDQMKGLNLPIDIFLKSLAEDHGENAIGIILSGTGSDGTRGVRAVKEAGGMVMVQEEENAKFDGMPRSAILTGIVDYILPVEKIPEALINFITDTVQLTPEKPQNKKTGKNNLAKILSIIKAKAGVDLSFYKESTIIRRIERRMGINRISSIDKYVRYLEEFPSEADTLFKEILIGVTSFFRDPEAYESLKADIFPEIMSRKSPGDPVRIWTTGCSTGEEAYSIAILLMEYFEEKNIYHDVKIFATDIDKEAIKFASFGIYPESIAADASSESLNKYFFKKGDSYQVVPKIREKVIFAYHNVIKDPPFGKIDLISCRNLLIYFQTVLQKKVLTNFTYSLNNNGFLFLGTSETVGELTSSFRIYSSKHKTYRFSGYSGTPEMNYSIPDIRISPQIEQPHNELSSAKNFREIDSIFEKLISAYFPPSVLIDENRNLIHVFSDINDYFRLPYGKVNFDIFKMAREEISLPLNNAVSQAMKENKNITYGDIPVKTIEGIQRINLSVRPVQSIKGNNYYIILFENISSTEDSCDREIQTFDIEKSVSKRINDLENELQYTEENLQATIEELETSNEELQATNEELIASNEELQSTNEELQSVNEELITVNSEYQKKIQELTELNDDISNLLASTDIGTIFLDNDLHIRKFTPAASGFVNIMESDLERAISHFSFGPEYDSLTSDVNEVLSTLSPKEVELLNSNGRWLLVRITPYRSLVERILGIVITFIDIHSRKTAELSRTREHELFIRVMESSPAPTTMVSKEGVITFANRRAEELLGLTRDRLGNITYDSDDFKITDTEGNPIRSEDLPFAVIMRTKESIQNFVHSIEKPDGTKTFLSITGNPIIDESGEIEGVVFKIEDLHCEKSSEGLICRFK